MLKLATALCSPRLWVPALPDLYPARRACVALLLGTSLLLLPSTSQAADEEGSETLGAATTSLLVEADAPYKVLIDGQPLAPGGPVAVGTRKVTLEVQGYSPWTTTLSFQEGITATLDFPSCAGMAVVQLTSEPPGAEVHLEGRLLGVTPLKVVGLKGETRVRVSASGFTTQHVMLPYELGLRDVEVTLDEIPEAPEPPDPDDARFNARISGLKVDRYPIGAGMLFFFDPKVIPMVNIGQAGFSYAFSNWRLPLVTFKWYATSFASPVPIAPSGDGFFFMFELGGIEYSGYRNEDIDDKEAIGVYTRLVPILGAALGNFDGVDRTSLLYGGEALVGLRYFLLDVALGAHWDNRNGPGLVLHIGTSFGDGPVDWF